MRLIDADALKELFPDDGEGSWTYNATAKAYIDAQPEHKTGRWILDRSGRGRHECSRCHEYAPCYQDGSEHLSTFCVLCGAKMESGGKQE